MTAAAIEPAGLLAAVRPLTDQLRELLDGDRSAEVPATLLDDLTTIRDGLTKLLTRARTRARRQAAAAEPKPVEPTPAVKPDLAPTSRKPAMPASTPAPTPRTTVPITPRPTTAPAPTVIRPRAAEPATSTRAPLPRWLALVAVVLVAVLGVAVAVTTGSPLGIAGAVVAAAAVGTVGRPRRRARPDRGPFWRRYLAGLLGVPRPAPRSDR